MFKKIKQFFQEFQRKLWLSGQNAKVRLAEERGDTNFISIAIVLIVVIGIAIVFIGFGKQITTKVSEAIQNLLNAL